MIQGNHFRWILARVQTCRVSVVSQHQHLRGLHMRTNFAIFTPAHRHLSALTFSRMKTDFMA
jgi:hypothetical protein